MTEGLSAVELQALNQQQRTTDLGTGGGGESVAEQKVREAAECLAAIEALDGPDRQIAELLHKVVQDEAAHLDHKTWNGFPAYARDGKVVVFFQPASKYDSRYGSIGFTEEAFLDDGDFWPTSFAVLAVSDKFEAKLRGLVVKAAG
ncbi:hypothetical protein N24_2706 [Corynebacterium suranareeae]|uniref:YdhG-like domain-containing protein n=1 Tax=Corynebacterium suranareeae TaxID=2506452 RepID=A0A161JP45_9CORY|nr:hypothetical protein [Corynebacterium suranareeae]BAU96968.1 hypothetical protein N24_2706 [Corynebacterium suranareeae]